MGFVAVARTMSGVGRLKRLCKGAFHVAGAIQETPSSEMLGGQGADYLRSAEFWSTKSLGLLALFCGTCAALCMICLHFLHGMRCTLHRWSGNIATKRWYEAVSSALNFPFLKESSQTFLRFRCSQLRKLRKLPGELARVI